MIPKKSCNKYQKKYIISNEGSIFVFTFDEIDLVGLQLPLNSKVKIINEDVFDYCPEDILNCIYMDIWNWINQDIYINEMRVLLDKYTEWLDFTDENSI